MSRSFKNYRWVLFAIIFACHGFYLFSQVDTSTLKAQVALGVNNPSSSGFVSNFQSKSVNFPTVNLGVQYMFSSSFGAKLDFGYNRFSNLNNTPTFKVNYTRINAQLVYDGLKNLGFLPQQTNLFLHAGPGLSFVKPLGNYPQNKTSFTNVLAGLEIHYGLSDSMSLYLDGSYMAGFGKDFNPVTKGYGSFNGDMVTLTVGVSLSLTGCYYCGDD